ncbi:MAG: type III secretion protein [Mailhella sp.]|nr:type III secretion protein [Mailhella sp.]
MPGPINLLTPSLGIQDVMPMTDPSQLPRARELAANALNEAGLDELFAKGNMRQMVELALCPEVGDGSILNPQFFQASLDSVVEAASDSSDPAVRAMVDQELIPLQQNKALLQAYLGLMIGG